MSDSDKKETKYQVYTSSMQAHKLIMPCGKVLHVTEGKYVTCNEDEIAFIDNEIELGFKYLKKGGTTTSATADPMAAMKAKMKEQLKAEVIKEYLAKEVKEANGETSPTVTPAEIIKPANTLDLSALKGQSGK